MSHTASINTGYMTNPVIRRVANKGAIAKDDNVATYKGVITKTFYFLVMTLVGIIGFFAVKQIGINAGLPLMISEDIEDGIFTISFTSLEAVVLLIATLVTIICCILSIFVRSIIPVAGTLYVLGEGYVLTFITYSLNDQYKWMGVVALVATIFLVISMLFLYLKGSVRVSARVQKTITATFITIILTGIVFFIISLIPGLSSLASVISAVVNNPVISIIFGIIFVVVACMFLLSDFEAVHDIVENGLDKKYEWACAYGIAYTVLYLYLKILQLLIRIFGKSSSSKKF